MSHGIPSGEMALVFKEALKIAVAERARRKFAATDHPGPSRGSANQRHIPATVKRAVCERDQGRCAFVNKTGKRCGSRSMLQFDHIEPVARGGASTVENLRLLCRLCRVRHKRHYAASGFMPRSRRGHRVHVPRAASYAA